MDLYEALKSGTSADELTRKFHEELAAAQDKIYEEKNLNCAREDLASAIYDYCCELMGEEGGLSIDEIEDILKEFEKNFSKASKFWSVNLKNCKSDEDIINAFIKSLK